MRTLKYLAIALLALCLTASADAKPKHKFGANGPGLGLGHYKHIWKVDGRADVAAKASLRESLRNGTFVDTDADLGSSTSRTFVDANGNLVTKTIATRRGWRGRR